jgi:hypothetical protein
LGSEPLFFIFFDSVIEYVALLLEDDFIGGTVELLEREL